MSDLTAVSLFAGIGGFDLALKRAGVRVVAAVEIDTACRGVLARHFPETHLFSDVTEVTGDQLRAAGFVPGRGILAAGWPCTGNSVAGRREGLADPRSGLWVHVARLLAELRPAWFLGENVPGLYSVNGGADITVVRRDLAQRGYWWAERILDAQWFGVPQRRRRVFFAGCLGDAAGPVQVLLEPEGGAGDSAARGRPGKGAPGVATDGAGVPGTVGTLGTTGPGGGWRLGADEAAAGQLVTGAASTLQGGGRRGHRVDAEGAAGGHLVPFDEAQVTSGENRSNPAPGNPAPGDPAPTLNQAGRIHVAETAYALTSRASRASRASREETYITHALTSEGFDASEDGTGRSTPIVPIGVPPMEVAAFNPQSGGGKARSGYGDKPTALQAHQVTAVQSAAAVRRLTPRECERLQGFPDDWTRWLADNTEQSDSARYRQCGNAVAVPVVEWVTRRVVAADSAVSGAETAA